MRDSISADRLPDGLRLGNRAQHGAQFCRHDLKGSIVIFPPDMPILDRIGETLAAVCVVALPFLLLFIAEAFK